MQKGNTFTRALRALCVLVLIAMPAGAAAAPPASSKQDAPPAGDPFREMLFAQSKDPEKKTWDHLLKYLRGTGVQVKAALDKDVFELAEKIGVAERQMELLSKRYEEQQKFLVDIVRESRAYKQIDADVAAAKADLEKARQNGDAQDRLAASSRYNKTRGQYAEMEKGTANDPSLADLTKERKTAEKRIKDLHQKLAKALEWRRYLVESIETPAMIQEPLVRGETMGILWNAKVVKALDHGSVIAEFVLFKAAKDIGNAEGVTIIHFNKRLVNVLVTKTNGPSLKVGDVIAPNQTFRVTEAPADDVAEMVVEPVSSDLEYLFTLIVPEPDPVALIAKAKEAAAKRSLD